MRLGLSIALTSALAATSIGCGGSTQQGDPRFGYRAENPGEVTEAPDWMNGLELDGGKLCGYGVAGAGYNAESPYPKKLSRERAIENLAGVLGTRVQEAIIDRQTNLNNNVQLARAITVDDALIEKVGSLAQTTYWLDVVGEGPYASKNFTYAHSCIEASVAADTFQVDPSAFDEAGTTSLVTPDDAPEWLGNYGTQSDGRLCAIGFSLPTFFPDKTFSNVVEDVRWQLAEVIHTFVSSYYEELTTERFQSIEAMTLATTEAVSKGAIVTNYWYDRDGIGPVKKERSTYGFGCVYPVQVLQTSAAKVEKTAPEDERKVIAKVRERAATAFDTLDAEIEKREREAQAPADEAPVPSTLDELAPPGES